MHLLLVSGKGSTLSKSIFCCFAGRLQRYPTLSVLIPNPGKIAKPRKMHFFAGFREGPNAIQRYLSLSQTLEKLQDLEKCIFCWFAGGPKFGKIAKPGKMHFLLLCGRAPTLSNAIRHYPRPDPKKIAKPGKMHFLLVSGKGSTLSNAIQRYPIRPYLRP